MQPELSIVIPAYNEALRLPPYLRSIRDYFRGASPEALEVIVVDDGSRDGLPEQIGQLALEWPQLRLLRHESNRGKGAAVRSGVLVASGRLVLFADADGATPIEEEAGLRAAIAAGADLAVGSRFLDKGSVRRSWHRRLLGDGFALMVRCLLSISVRDTQCGFKMFRRDAGQMLLRGCREDGYLFDLHVLSLAGRLGLRTEEVAVRWTDVPGSKVRLLRDSCRMFRALIRLRQEVSTAAEAEARGTAISPT